MITNASFHFCVSKQVFRSASSAEITRRISGGLTPKARVTPRAQDLHQKMLNNASETSSHASNDFSSSKPNPTHITKDRFIVL